MAGKITRRDFVGTSLAASATLLLPTSVLGLPFRAYSLSDNASEPHFFIHIHYAGGMDASYLFDARPLKMTQAGKIQNYLGKEPKVWTGMNGQNCLATELTSPLGAHRDYFSIINGVHVSQSFDGHDQNVNLIFTGNVFGDECFIPHLNVHRSGAQSPKILDAAMAGFFQVSSTNMGNCVPLGGESAKVLVQKLKAIEGPVAGNPLFSFIQGRLQANSQGGGRFSAGAQAMAKGFGLAPLLREKLEKLIPKDPPADAAAEVKAAQVFFDLFKTDVTANGIFMTFDDNLDCHDPASAKSYPAQVKTVVERIAAFFKSLRETPYDQTRSFADVTTFCVTTDFSRTMRQKGLAIDATGTDHNPLTSTVLIGGKGIKGGMVVGASDFQTAEENLSGAHKILDSDQIKIMGLPFDFMTFTPRNDRPESFDVGHYLNIGSVINTIYDVFGVKRSLFRLVKRTGEVAPVLAPLRK